MSNLRIERTDHYKFMDNEVRNYFVTYPRALSINDIKKETELFANKHRPISGTINIFLYLDYKTANIEDYKLLTGKEYLRFCENHPYAYYHNVFVENPMGNDEYDYILNNLDRFKDMVFDDIVRIQYEDKLQNNPDQLRKFKQYQNENGKENSQSS